MNSLKLAEKRHSAREYKHKKLTEKDRQYLDRQLIEKPVVFLGSSLEFHFIEEGHEIASQLEGIVGYFGKMIVAPHYYALLCEPEDLCHKAVGYEGEWLILKALRQDIGTCWLEVKNSKAVKAVLGIEDQKEVAAMIAIGYSKKEHQHSNIYATTGSGSLSSLTDLGYPNINAFNTQAPISSRKSITEFVYINQWGNTPGIEDLEKMGVHVALFYMRLAPSYENRQPWYFLFKNNEIDLIVEKSDHISKTVQGIDAGIAMLYFEVGLHDAGIAGKWNFSDFDADYSIPDDYKIVGRYSY